MIGHLQAEVDALREQHEKLLQDFKTLDLEMTNQVDRLAGIAKRFTGRKGGRPPNKPENGEESVSDENAAQIPFTRHIF